MLYKVQKKDIERAGRVLADAFQDDPAWSKIFEGESNSMKKLRANFEVSLRLGLKYGEAVRGDKSFGFNRAGGAVGNGFLEAEAGHFEERGGIACPGMVLGRQERLADLAPTGMAAGQVLVGAETVALAQPDPAGKQQDGHGHLVAPEGGALPERLSGRLEIAG